MYEFGASLVQIFPAINIQFQNGVSRRRKFDLHNIPQWAASVIGNQIENQVFQSRIVANEKNGFRIAFLFTQQVNQRR